MRDIPTLNIRVRLSGILSLSMAVKVSLAASAAAEFAASPKAADRLIIVPFVKNDYRPHRN